MISVLLSAGWPIYPLLLCSIVALSIIIERTIALRVACCVPSNLLRTIKERLSAGEPAVDISLGITKTPLGQVFSAALKTSTGAHSKEALEDAGRLASYSMEKRLSALGTIATASPLLGLLGTVVGMIEIFGASASAGTDPQALAHGISVALYNTAFGLIIAIPSLMFYRYLKNRVEEYSVMMESLTIELCDFLEKQ